jgi:hypothetical protein
MGENKNVYERYQSNCKWKKFDENGRGIFKITVSVRVSMH